MTKCHKQEGFGILHFENSDLFRTSIFEFRISRLSTLFGSGYAGLGGGGGLRDVDHDFHGSNEVHEGMHDNRYVDRVCFQPGVPEKQAKHQDHDEAIKVVLDVEGCPD